MSADCTRKIYMLTRRPDIFFANSAADEFLSGIMEAQKSRPRCPGKQ